jgi:hypothetical protein
VQHTPSLGERQNLAISLLNSLLAGKNAAREQFAQYCLHSHTFNDIEPDSGDHSDDAGAA